MPIYPYVCTACGHEFDSLQKFSDDPLKDCPECGEERLRKRLTAPSFQLKGTGWYETDFKHSDKKQKSDGKDKEGDSKQGQEGQGEGKKEQAGTASESAQGSDKGGDQGSDQRSAKGGSQASTSKPAAGRDD